MILLRKNAFSETSITIPFIEEETLDVLLVRTILANGYEDTDTIREHFQILVNGLKVDRELWPIVKVLERDSVLIAPVIAGGSGGQLFKTFAIIAITLVASVFLTPATGATIGSALMVAAVSVGSSLLLNALIPPPVPGLGGLGGLGSAFEGSQMYSITSQNNSVKKFGYVPRVYGRHRIFPLIAANPYTEIEADPETKTLVQYFYAIYDFGFGPLNISDIRIGDTSIGDFANADWNLVDLNRPLVDEGPWDESLESAFEFYKGDVEKDPSSVSLDKNQSAGGPLDDYQVVRNASAAVNGASQEISLDFVCPAGLISYGTDGTTAKRTIELKVEFSKASENVWHEFNNTSFVSDFSTTGGEGNVFKTKAIQVPLLVPANYTFLDQTGPFRSHSENKADIRQYTYGYPKNGTFVEGLIGSAVVGSPVIYNGAVVGKIASIAASTIPGHEKYILVAPLKKRVAIYTRTVRTQIYFPYSVISDSITSNPSLTNKLFGKVFSAGTVLVSDKNTSQIYFTVKFKPLAIDAYKVRVTRVTSYSTKTYQIRDGLTLLSISTRFDRSPILTTKRHVFLELRIRATNQLNGAVQNLSATASSVLDVYDDNTQTWSLQETSNPAWVYCDLLTGVVNPRALDKSRLHMESIVEWSEFCDEVPPSPPSSTYFDPRFSCDFVLDFDTTLQSIINQIANASQASLNIIDGKYGVLIDKLKTVPLQIFTPRNSWGFTSSRNYSDPAQALKIRFVSPSKGWELDEAIVYAEGFDANNTTDFQELSTFACTSFEQAWRFGRYAMAQSKLRQETMSLSVDFEHIVCTRGDYVQITQDVMKVGGRPARVKSVVGTVITIDDAIDTVPGSYGYVFRSPTAGIYTNTLTVIDSDEFDLDGTLPNVGDLIIIGEVANLVYDCIVKTISPNSDYSATISLVERAAAIYDSESTITDPEYSPGINQNQDTDLAIPPAVEDLIVTDNTWRVVGSSYQYYIGLDWDIPTGAAVETYEIYVDSGSGYNLVDYTKESFYEYIVHEENLGIEHFFKVIGVSATGKKLDLISAPEVSATPIKKFTKPSDVSALYINITGEVIQLDWPQVSDPDLREYLIRYTPATVEATWEASLQLARISRVNAISVQGRTGTYFIKAVDLNYNESEIAAQARTSIPKLFDLNIISETNDFPSLPGELITTETDGVGLVLKRIVSGGSDNNQYYPEGYYYYSQFLDLGEIYTVRLQSLIEAEGFAAADLMSNWPSLDAVLLMSNAGQASWDVETYYRATDTFNVIADWPQLSLIDPLSEGQQDNWTNWTKFTIGDFTGRIFQFRLKLISNGPSVTPRVYDGIIRADMPDRVFSLENVTSNAGVTSVAYTPAFKGPGTSPNVQISQDNAQQGDYYVLSNKTLDGFDITFYDINSVAVIRQFDVSVKGFGRLALAVI